METPKEHYYTYYSYEEWGRGYFGSRKCYCLPEEDVKYFGSSKDKTFKPKYKIILKDDYATREEAYADEIILQQYYKVVENPHFANKAYQTSTKFYVPTEQRIEIGKRGGKISGQKHKENKTGVFARSKEKMSEDGKKAGKIGGKIAGQKSKENKTGVCGRTKEQRIEDGKKGAKRSKELGIGIFALTAEKLSENGKKGGSISGKMTYENKTGLFSLTLEERLKVVEKTNSQKWMCLETGYTSTAAGVVAYQRKRGIDTTKRKRIS